MTSTNKIRCIISLLTTKNYIVITDTINDGLVEPYAADEFSSQIEPIYQHLLELMRSVNTPEDI